MKLYPEQEKVLQQAVEILDKYKMCYLALRPRFGKSLIAAQLADRYMEKGSRILFVSTKSAQAGIHKVIQEMGIAADIEVTTYGSTHKCKGTYDLIIADEAHSNISSYPRMSKAREKLDSLIHSKTIIVWMSGTPSIESSSKLYHQLSLSPFHSFSKYDSFYHWFNGSAHYKNKTDNLIGYGIQGLTKYTGGSRPAINYDHTINFDDKFKPIMISRAEEEAAVKVIPCYVEPPKIIKEGISSIATKSIFISDYGIFIAEGGAGRLSKAHQLSGGTAIDDKDTSVFIDAFKAKEIYEKHKGNNCCIFYRYKAEKRLLCIYFPEEDLYQIDSNCTGIDMSHYDEAIVYSLTWSGSNYLQVLNRLVNSEREDIPKVYVYLTKGGPDQKIFEAVSNKRDYNQKFLKDKE